MGTEKRLIDANALKALFDERYDDAFIQMYARLNKEYWDGVCGGVNWGRNTIADAPTVDAVEVVRCKDCTRYKKGYCTIRKDSWGATLMVGLTDFCSDGERKDNEQT